MSKACEDGFCPDCSGKTIEQMCEELKIMRRYSDFVHGLANRDHSLDCPVDEGYPNEDCTCIVGKAVDCVMGFKR